MSGRATVTPPSYVQALLEEAAAEAVELLEDLDPEAVQGWDDDNVYRHQRAIRMLTRALSAARSTNPERNPWP